MSATPRAAAAVTAPGATLRQRGTLERAPAPSLARRLAGRLGGEWLAHAAWAIDRSGRAGLLGLALLVAAALFVVSTHLGVAAEVRGLQVDLWRAQQQAGAAEADQAGEVDPAVRPLPARQEMPAILGELYAQAARAQLSVDVAKYETSSSRSGGLVRHQITFPVTGTYPQIRAFIDATLAAMPAVALGDLQLERKTIHDGNVEAQIRLNVYTRSAP